MYTVLKTIRDWSEVWALLIPLLVMLVYPFTGKVMKPVRIYVWTGLVLSLASTIMFVFHKQMPETLKNNNLVYNIHSLVRVILFSWFIIQFSFGRKNNLPRILVIVYLLFTLWNFINWTSPLQFSTLHFIAESIVLLMLCLLFFFRTIRDESTTDWIKQPAFIVCAGLSLYEAVNFFTFLFFETLTRYNLQFLKIAWTIHNITFVVLCIMLALALYSAKTRERPFIQPFSN